MIPSRRKFLVSVSAALLTAHPAMAQDEAVTRSVIRQLEAQGFDVVSVRRTLLGRVRILSRRSELRREIVLDPRNGVILRDYTAGAGGNPTISGSADGASDEHDGPASGDNGGHGGDDDGGDDDGGGDGGGDDDDGDDDGGDDDGGDDDGGDDDGGDDDGGDDGGGDDDDD